jgi:hypothetical protein
LDEDVVADFGLGDVGQAAVDQRLAVADLRHRQGAGDDFDDG